MVQSALATAVKQGDPKAIALLLNKALGPRGIATKVLRQGDRLHILLTAPVAPPRDTLICFLKQGLEQWQPEAIAVVSVQGRAQDQTEPAWQTSFRLSPTLPPESSLAAQPNTQIIAPHPSRTSRRSPTKPPPRSLAQPWLALIASRNGERAGLVLATFLLTSLLWSLVGGGETAESPSQSSLGARLGQRSLQGRLVLIDNKIADAGPHCHGTNGYSDIDADLRITVRDGRGHLLATGATQPGYRPPAPGPAAQQCIFEFQLRVPKADFYSIAVGRRGELSYSRQELEAKRWRVQFTLAP